MDFLNKPTSVKFPKEMLADIDNECKGLGCNRTDFIREAVKEKLDGKAQDQEENSSGPDRNTTPKEEPKPTPERIELIPKARNKKISYDNGKTWNDIPELKNPKIVEVGFNPSDYEVDSEPKITIKEIPQDNSNKPKVEMVLFNGKYIPKAEVYEI